MREILRVPGAPRLEQCKARFTFIGLETDLTTLGGVRYAFSDGYTNAGTLLDGSIILH